MKQREKNNWKKSVDFGITSTGKICTGKEKKGHTSKISEETIGLHFPNLMRNLNIQESQQSLSKSYQTSS
jgi:hypothetical protein